MQKTAVVYDKWLPSLGGGEIVACNMAKILKDNNYKVIFVSGKCVPLSLIKNILGLDLSGIQFITVWNDELSLKEIVQHKDLFINASFIDYSIAYARKNIYYAHFPTRPYSTIKSIILNKYLFPYLTQFIKPIEFINEPKGMTVINDRFVYSLDTPVDIAFSYLVINKTYQIKFSVFFESFYKNILLALYWRVEKADICGNVIRMDHHHNVAHFLINIQPKSHTVYLHLRLRKKFIANSYKTRIYLLHPKILPSLPLSEHLFKRFYERLNNKLRAGLFVDALKRLGGYQLLVTHSQFVRKWINNYWKKDAIVLYPPVEMFYKKYDLTKYKKKKWICSVGRFFTLGHGKKQEVLVDAFKKFYNFGFRDWQLHLIGGLGNEPSSLRFAEYLKKKAKGYPIFFHLNVDRKEVERIILNSKIYWHATGFGENENSQPIKFEHFGIAPIEAISAKCIPILYNGGGLKEIISILKLDQQRNLFNTIDELIDNTIYYIKNEDKISWFEVFKCLNHQFSVEAFKRSFLEIIKS